MSDDMFESNAGIEDHLIDLRRWRRLHAEDIEKTNIELASIEETTSEAANKLREHLIELDLACKQLDWLIEEEVVWLRSDEIEKNTTEAPTSKTTKQKIVDNHVKTPVEFSLTKSEQMANVMALRTRGLKPETKQYSLDFFCNISSDKKIQPNDIARSALWTVQTTLKRDYVKNSPIFSSNPTLNIFYTGEELQAATDEKIWLQLIFYARKVEFGEKIQVQISQICEDVGWDKSGHYYSTVWASLERLHYAGLKIKKGKNRVLAFIRMLNLHTVKGDNVLDNGSIEYSLDNSLNGWLLLVAGNTTTLLESKAMKILTPVAQRLYTWLASHKEPQPLSIFDFHKLCASISLLETPQHLASWRKSIRMAIEVLKKENLIKNATVKNNCIFIER